MTGDGRLDTERLQQFQLGLFSQLSGAVTAAMVYLGDRLGLYRQLATAGPGGATTAELAAATGCDERWVREWAFNQGAAGLVEIAEDEAVDRSAGGDPSGSVTVTLSPEGVAVLADETSERFAAGSFQQLPGLVGDLDAIATSFRTGLGYDYDHQGDEAAAGSERGFEIWHRHHLIDDVVPLLDGAAPALAAGATVADVGCGAGGVVLLLAAAFPHSRVTGYDISRLALARAEDRRARANLGNAAFVHLADGELPADGSLDLVTTVDCLHDMVDPAGMAKRIRAAIRPDGSWLVVDIKALDGYHANVAKNPMAAMMYGISVLGCLSSALSEPGGAGLGTLGLSADVLERLVRDAGFTRLRRLAVDHPVNAFYEIRP